MIVQFAGLSGDLLGQMPYLPIIRIILSILALRWRIELRRE
jgi:hypothetical protein